MNDLTCSPLFYILLEDMGQYGGNIENKSSFKTITSYLISRMYFVTFLFLSVFAEKK